MNKLLTLGALVAVIAGGWWLTRDPGRIGIYDADLNRLAETPREAYCAGVVFWETQSRGDPRSVQKCISEHPTYNDQINHAAVIQHFCLGAKDGGFHGNPYVECQLVVEARRWWPTMKGTLSQAFDDRYPYPGDTFTPARSDTPPERGFEREGTTR